MPFNVLLLPLLGGYIFITQWNRTRFRTKRDTGERLLFHAGLAGVVFLVVAFLAVHLIAAVSPALHGAWTRHVPFPYAGTSLVALLLGALGWWPANLLSPRDKEARRVLREWGDHLEILFDRALTENRQISVTLKGGKVYIGFVLENFDPSYERKYITILPIASGYRDAEDQAVILTTSYGEVYVRIMNHRTDLNLDDFRIVIPVAEVQSANLFDWDAFDEFQSLEAEGASGYDDASTDSVPMPVPSSSQRPPQPTAPSALPHPPETAPKHLPEDDDGT